MDKADLRASLVMFLLLGSWFLGGMGWGVDLFRAQVSLHFRSSCLSWSSSELDLRGSGLIIWFFLLTPYLQPLFTSYHYPLHTSTSTTTSWTPSYSFLTSPSQI
jgi:hypothetical protein